MIKKQKQQNKKLPSASTIPSLTLQKEKAVPSKIVNLLLNSYNLYMETSVLSDV